MSLNNPLGQSVPIEYVDESQKTRIERAVKTLEENRPALQRWFWKGLLAFNLILASLVFWLGIVPRLM